MLRETSTFKLMTVSTIIIFSLLISAGQAIPAIELKIAADANIDKEISEIAMATDLQSVKEDNLSAKWLVVNNELPGIIDSNLPLVTKERGGVLFLLVLENKDDIRTKDIDKLRSMLDRYGKEAMEVILTESGKENIARLTKNNINRYAAIIIKDQVYGVHQIKARLRESFLVPKIISDDEFLLESDRAQSRFAMPLEYLFWILAFGLILLIGAVSGGFSKKQKHPVIYIIVGLCIGGLLGSYILGVQTSYGTAGIDETHGIFTKTTQFNIIYMVVGALLGGGLGFVAGYVMVPLLSKLVSPSKIISSRIVLVIGLALILFLIIFPPWKGSETEIIPEGQTEGYAGSPYEFMGFHFVLSGEQLSQESLYVIIKIDYALLAMLYFIVILVCGTVLCLLRAQARKLSKMG